MPTRDELKMMQALPLDLKIRKTQQRIREWVSYYGVDGVYVSFSGGKDSTVLLDIVRKMYPDIEAVFVNTGLEYSEIQSFVKTYDNVTVRYPKMRFDEVIREYGYPFIGKEVAQRVENARRCLSGGVESISKITISSQKSFPMRTQQLLGIGGFFSKRYDFSKWKDLLNVDFRISPRCCNVMKKAPLKSLHKAAIIATMAEESNLRTTAWLRQGCNAFDSKDAKSKPLSFWTNQDILQYIKQNNIPIASVYGDIVYGERDSDEQYYNLLCDCGQKLCTTKCDRTGCIFCGFGAHLEKGEGRFRRLKHTHPRQYDYCMGGGGYDLDGFWKPTKDGLGMAHCIEELNKIYGKEFIKL